MDGTATTKKMDTVPAQAENELAVSEISQPDEKQSTVSEQKPNSPEQPTEVFQAQPASVPSTKAEEKARQPVVLNPVPHQQAQKPQENKPVSAAEENTNTCKDSESFEAALKTDQDLVKEIGTKEPRPKTPQAASLETSSQTVADSATQNDRIERSQSPVNSLQSVLPPPGPTKRRFTVRKVEDPALNSMPSSEVQFENNTPEQPSVLDTCSNTERNCENEDISRKPESELNQELSDDVVLHEKLTGKESLCPSGQVAGDTTNSKQHHHVETSDTGPTLTALHEVEQRQINFEGQASTAGGKRLQIEPTSSSCRPPTPTYAFHPVDNSVPDEQALPQHNVKFESQISGEELNADKPKVECVVSSDDELPISAPTEKEGVLGRFIVSTPSDRPNTPSFDTSDQAKPPLQPVEITLQDVTTAVGMGSNASLTPSSSVESLNSVGSQPGVQYMHAFSSSPQTILPDGQSSSNIVTVSTKDQARKNSGPNDNVLIDGSRQSLGKQEGEQVQIL